MKTYFNILMLIFAVMLMSKPTSAAEVLSANDSIFINFGKKGKIAIYVSDSTERRKLTELDLNQLVEKATVYMDTTTQEVRVIVIKDGKMEPVLAKEKGKRVVTVGTDGIHIYTKKGIGDEIREEIEKEISNEKDKAKNELKKVTSGWHLYLGLNNLVENGSIVNGTAYELQPWRSRYVAVGYTGSVRLGNSPFRLSTGLQLSWYNFMFENNTRVAKTATGVDFYNTSENLSKSKLTVAYLNAPVMLRYSKRVGKSADEDKKFKLGIGGYAGYRLDAYNAFKVKGENDKVRQHSGFHLNNIRYGITGEIGLFGMELFANYDLNSLFADGKGPELRGFSFGVRL